MRDEEGRDTVAKSDEGVVGMTRGEMLDVVKEIVTKQRAVQHGHPEDNFANIASFWSGYLTMKSNATLGTVDIDTRDVAAMMILFKLARSVHSPENVDNWIDAAGYDACGCEVATRRKS